jgi:hypothetical protein
MLSQRLDRATVGPLLRELIATQQAKEQALRFPQIRALASELVRHCHDLDLPLLWPIGQAGERLAGASIVVAEGDLRLRGWSDDIRGERVLLMAVAETTPMSMVEGATHARSLGAVEVHACALQVVGFESPELDSVFDSRVVLGPVPVAMPLAAVN